LATRPGSALQVLDGSNAMSKLQLPMPPPGMVGHPMFTYNRGHSPYPVQPDAFMIAAECCEDPVGPMPGYVSAVRRTDTYLNPDRQIAKPKAKQTSIVEQRSKHPTQPWYFHSAPHDVSGTVFMGLPNFGRPEYFRFQSFGHEDGAGPPPTFLAFPRAGDGTPCDSGKYYDEATKQAFDAALSQIAPLVTTAHPELSARERALDSFYDVALDRQEAIREEEATLHEKFVPRPKDDLTVTRRHLINTAGFTTQIREHRDALWAHAQENICQEEKELESAAYAYDDELSRFRRSKGL